MTEAIERNNRIAMVEMFSPATEAEDIKGFTDRFSRYISGKNTLLHRCSESVA